MIAAILVAAAGATAAIFKSKVVAYATARCPER